MKGFIRLTNVFQDAPTLLNIHSIAYLYRQDVGNKHTVINTLGAQHCLSVKEDFDEIVKMIEAELKDSK